MTNGNVNNDHLLMPPVFNMASAENGENHKREISITQILAVIDWWYLPLNLCLGEISLFIIVWKILPWRFQFLRWLTIMPDEFCHKNCCCCMVTIFWNNNYGDVIMSAMTSQIAGTSIVYSGAGQKISKLRITGLCRGNPLVTGGFPHKGPVTRKCFHLMTSSCNTAISILKQAVSYPCGCQPDDPLPSLVTINRIINVYDFLVVIMLFLYFVLHCLYSAENKITTVKLLI